MITCNMLPSNFGRNAGLETFLSSEMMMEYCTIVLINIVL